MTEETAITGTETAASEETTETTETTETGTETTTTETAQPETTQTETSSTDAGSTEESIDPDSYTVPEEVPKELKQWAAKEGFTDTQFKAALGKYQEAISTIQQGTLQQLENLGKKQLEEWGDQAQTKLGVAKQALNQFDVTGHVKELLKTSGYGNHPAVLQMFAAIGEALGEGKFVDGPATTPTKKSMAEKMYPSMSKGD
jgi:hypothetical protein